MSEGHQHVAHAPAETPGEVDAVVVGAGFAGLYMLHRLRALGLSVRVYEAGSGVGGTWFWNRYPGARCDVESVEYSYSFSPELQQEWRWTERYASQAEILRYLNHVADRFDLRRDIRLETRVTACVFDETTSRWTVQTDAGARVTARFCIMATGALSAARVPPIEGLATFSGRSFHTGNWPLQGVDFTGQRVGILGTGSSAVQAIPLIAEQAAHLFVFQRTPNFSVPAKNAAVSPAQEQRWKTSYPEQRRLARDTFFGSFLLQGSAQSALEVTPEERLRTYESGWQTGGLGFLVSYADMLVNRESNETAAEFVRAKIRETVRDPVIAARLSPTDHPLGTKRLCVNTHYYETFNRDNVTLVDLRSSPIEAITPEGLRTQGAAYDLDSLVFATGFDALTGALLNIDIRGKAGLTLQEKWAEGPRTYLGVAVSGFPNFFTIAGAGSPSVLTNMVVSIEHHVEWIAGVIEHLQEQALARVEATVEAEDEWVAHVNEVANYTLFPLASSWYTGANVPGKPRIFMPYVGGFAVYTKKLAEVVERGYEGFSLNA